jgi:hypothetical protein
MSGSCGSSTSDAAEECSPTYKVAPSTSGMNEMQTFAPRKKLPGGCSGDWHCFLYRRYLPYWCRPETEMLSFPKGVVGF